MDAWHCPERRLDSGQELLAQGHEILAQDDPKELGQSCH